MSSERILKPAVVFACTSAAANSVVPSISRLHLKRLCLFLAVRIALIYPVAYLPGELLGLCEGR